MEDPVAEVLAVIVQQLRAALKGDGQALADLGEWLDSGDFDREAVQSAMQFLLQVVEPYTSGIYVEKGTRRKVNNRILDRAERALLSREAYGHLIQLRDQGKLDDLQLELVLNQIVGTRSDPVDLDEVKRIINVVLFHSPEGEGDDTLPFGEDELPRPQ
ncbi:MAG TPA: DUF494 family protein [Candidatus Udaeobacter sp.]|nr:DUF494 family protein [Candidatus Udaeobacter sp.]